MRDHVGWVWYQKNVVVPRSWSSKQTLALRFESVHYFARVVRIFSLTFLTTKSANVFPVVDKWRVCRGA